MNTAPPTAEQVADCLDYAADELDQRGHAKGSLMDAGGRVCLLGAAACGAGLDLQRVNRYDINPSNLGHNAAVTTDSPLWEACRTALSSRGFGWGWNDMHSRTASQVWDALKGTAKAIRNGEVQVDG